MAQRNRPAALTGQNVGAAPDLTVVPHDGSDVEVESVLTDATGDRYLQLAVERGDLTALREIAKAAGEMVAAGMPAQTEPQMRAASALQRAVLNLPR